MKRSVLALSFSPLWQLRRKQMAKAGLWISLACLLLVGVASMAAAQVSATAAYIRGANPPWGQNTNETAMTTVFGAQGVGWNDLRMAGGPGPFLLTSGYSFIFLEGSDSTANELNSYLAANRAVIEAFVASGGALLLNSAPNQGGNIDFGFGGITLNYRAFSRTVTGADPAHPVFLGPYGATGISFAGNFFGHSVVSGAGLLPILNGTGGQAVLAEKPWGRGLVVFGGMTTTNWHSPQPQATNLRANIIDYTANNAFVDTDGDGFPDRWELTYGTDPNDPADPVATEDVDGDGLDWSEEFANGTNPLVADTDGDQVNDGDEVNVYGTNPLVKDPVTIVDSGPAAEIDVVWFEFDVTLLDPETTGFRVYYGASHGENPEDYFGYYDLDVDARDGTIHRDWGLQGVPEVYVRIAPIRTINPTFVGILSDEVVVYFEQGLDSTYGADALYEDLEAAAEKGNDINGSDDSGGFCFIRALGLRGAQ